MAMLCVCVLVTFNAAGITSTIAPGMGCMGHVLCLPREAQEAQALGHVDAAPEHKLHGVHATTASSDIMSSWP